MKLEVVLPQKISSFRAVHNLSITAAMGHSSGDGTTFVSTAIAVDKDKNSPHAVRWAVENLVKKNASVYLVHVRNNTSQPSTFFTFACGFRIVSFFVICSLASSGFEFW